MPISWENFRAAYPQALELFRDPIPLGEVRVHLYLVVYPKGGLEKGLHVYLKGLPGLCYHAYVTAYTGGHQNPLLEIIRRAPLGKTYTIQVGPKRESGPYLITVFRPD